MNIREKLHSTFFTRMQITFFLKIEPFFERSKTDILDSRIQKYLSYEYLMPKSEKSLYQLVHVQMPCDLLLRMDSYSNEFETEIDLFSSFTLIILANSANMPVHRHVIFILFIFTFFTFSHCVLTEISVWLSNQYEIMNILWKKEKTLVILYNLSYVTNSFWNTKMC